MLSLPYPIKFLFIVLVLSLFSQAAMAGSLSLSELSKIFEDKLLQKLVEAKEGASINAFTSDGCSGGLSDGWASVSKHFPPFNTQFGSVPPWQDCCVAHDKLYWQGETEHGYEQRKKADEALMQCVKDTGVKLAPDLSQRYHVSESEIERGFNIVAMTMYRAVRLGGRPCSGFPWRWGYGWPNCRLFSNAKESADEF